MRARECCWSTSSGRALRAALQASAARARPSGHRRSRRCRPHKPAGATEWPYLQSARLKRLNTETVQCWRTVQQYRMLANHFSEDIPDLWRLSLNHLLGRFNRARKTASSSLPKINGLNSSKAIFLGRPHWCSLRVGPVHDHRTTGVVHTLTQQSSDGNDLACL